MWAEPADTGLSSPPADEVTDEERRAALLGELEALRSAGQIGRRTHQFLRRAIERAKTLPPDEATFDRWFRAVCHRKEGDLYSRSRRADFAREFRRVAHRWAEAGVIAQSWQVRPPHQRKPALLVDTAVYRRVRISEIEALWRAFLDDLGQPHDTATPAEEVQWTAFCRAAFALIVQGGMAWHGCMVTLADMCWRHLSTAARGYIHVPRWGVEYRVYIPPVVSVCALALGLHLPRAGRWAAPDPDRLLLPAPNPDRRRGALLRETRGRFNRYLAGLCRRAGIHALTLSDLVEASRFALVARYGEVVAGALLGSTPYNPLPDDQADLCSTYLEAPDLPVELPAPPPAAVSSGNISPRRTTVSRERAEPSLCLIADLEERLLQASAALISDGPLPRQRIADDLESLARDLLARAGTAGTGDIRALLAACRHRLEAEQDRGSDLEHYNVAVLAAWLAHLCRSTSLRAATLRTYRSAGNTVIYVLADRPLYDLGSDDLADLAGLQLEDSTRSRLVGVALALRAFALGQGGEAGSTPLPDGGRRPAIANRPHPVRLLGLADLLRLLAELRGAAAEVEGGRPAHPARNAYLAALLMAFFGLRPVDTVRLCLGDMVLEAGQPYLRVRRSKRGGSRVVPARHVPGWVMEALRAEWRRRWGETGEDAEATFLDTVEGEKTTLQAVLRAITAGLRRLGLREAADGRSVTPYTLRHVYANRLLVLGVPLLEIARSLGHTDVRITTHNYLHVFDWLQKRGLERMAERPDEGLTAKAVGAPLGIGRTAALAALQKAGCRGVLLPDGRRVYLYRDVMRFLADRVREPAGLVPHGRDRR